jgi:hypothetical protein
MEIQCHQHRGPVDGVRRQDVFADQMDVRRPESQTGRPAVRKILERRDVIDERVEPDIGDVLLVEGQFDAPREPGFRS